MTTRQEELNAEDLYGWTQNQMAALRSLGKVRWNGPLDLEHLAEEAEDLGRSTRNAVRSQLQRIIEHRGGSKQSSATEPRAGWMNSIYEGRDQVENPLTQSLRHELEDQLSHLYTRGVVWT